MKKYFINTILALLIILPSVVLAEKTTTFNLDIIVSPQCFDGLDNDGDTKIDYPDDLGCSSPGDNNETNPPTPPPATTTPPSTGGGGSSGGGGGGGYPVNPITTLTLTGFAYPYAQITILKDAQATALVQAGGDASFKFTTDKLSPGSYNFSIYATDVFGIRSSLYNVPVTIAYGSLAQVSNIFISPTIGFEKSNLTPAEGAVIRGQARPGSQVSISIASTTEQWYSVLAGADGKYLYTLNQGTLSLGTYQARAKAVVKQEVSNFSQFASLLVSEKVLELQSCILQKKGDINCDGKINIIDFSILAYWYERANAPLKYDLNGDKKINLIDFSIMAFHWTV
jgi:hypothetical protein